MQFHDILASIIHDMKNSLSMVINTLDEITSNSTADIQQTPEIKLLQQEAKRLNNNLIELLTLYKIENERISANIDEIYMPDFLADIEAENRIAAMANDIKLTWQCDDDLHGFFDEGLIRGVINNLVGNGLRYTRSEMRVSACMDNGYLVIRVEDDGDGFPDHMLEAQENIDNHEQLLNGRTQLGIFFSSMVAKMHQNKSKVGFIRLENGRDLSGGCFSVSLP